MSKEKLTKDHEVYISVGLETPMKPETFCEIVDKLLFENIGYMKSWGVHTKEEYIDCVKQYEEKIRHLERQNKHLKEELSNKWQQALAKI
jgi:hypothetical protein